MDHQRTKTISWIAAITASIILLQTLYFKFSASPESVYIFSKLGLEPYGRISIGIAELITSILLLIPSTRIWGAAAGLGIMIGAVVSHVTVLGIEVQGDGGYLFILAIIVVLACCLCLFMEKDKILYFIHRVFPSR